MTMTELQIGDQVQTGKVFNLKGFVLYFQIELITVNVKRIHFEI